MTIKTFGSYDVLPCNQSRIHNQILAVLSNHGKNCSFANAARPISTLVRPNLETHSSAFWVLVCILVCRGV